MKPLVIELMLFAPLCGVKPRDRQKTIHAVTMEAISTYDGDRSLLPAACGEEVEIIGLPGGGVGLWPSRVKAGRPPRCRACYLKTGKPRLRKARPIPSKLETHR